MEQFEAGILDQLLSIEDAVIVDFLCRSAKTVNARHDQMLHLVFLDQMLTRLRILLEQYNIA